LNTTQSTTASITNKNKPSEDKFHVEKVVKREIENKSLIPKSKESKFSNSDLKRNEIEAKKYKKKNQADKVIRDSFPFPEKDYEILSKLKKSCIADGTPVKRGEILRAGLLLLNNLTLPELKQAIEKVEKIQSKQTKP
jgi:hypothetical protein